MKGLVLSSVLTGTIYIAVWFYVHKTMLEAAAACIFWFVVTRSVLSITSTVITFLGNSRAVNHDVMNGLELKALQIFPYLVENPII